MSLNISSDNISFFPGASPSACDFNVNLLISLTVKVSYLLAAGHFLDLSHSSTAKYCVDFCCH